VIPCTGSEGSGGVCAGEADVCEEEFATGGKVKPREKMGKEERKRMVCSEQRALQ